METQTRFWDALADKYQTRNFELEERICNLQHRLDGMSCSMPTALLRRMFQKPLNQTNGPSSYNTTTKSVAPYEPFRNSAESNLSKLTYTNQLCILATEEKQIKSQTAAMEFKRETCIKTLCQSDNLNHRPLNQINETSKYEVMNEHIIEENKKVAEKLKDVKLEFKHCMQRIEIPLAKQIEDRRRKSEELKNNLRLVSSILDSKEICHVQDRNTLQTRLNCTCRSINDAKNTNKKLNQELCTLQCKYQELQVDMVRQKLSEADTIERLSQGLCMKQAMGDYKEIGRKQSFEDCKKASLEELARRLSRTLLEIERCNQCKLQLPEDLKETIRGINKLLDLIHSKIQKRRKITITSKASLSPSPSEGEHRDRNELTKTRSTTTSIRSKIDVSIQHVEETIRADVETETRISVSSSVHSVSLSQESSQISIETLCIESEISIEKEEIAQEIAKEASRTDLIEDVVRESSEEILPSTDVKLKLSIEELAVSETALLKEELSLSESLSLLLSAISSTEKLQQSSSIKYSSSPALMHKKLSTERPIPRPYSALTSFEMYTEPQKIISVKQRSSDLLEEIGTEAELYDKISGDINIITTVTKSGNFEIITESPEAIIESIVTRTESGNIDITTEVIKYANEDFQRYTSESELETSVSSTSYVTISSSQLLAEKSLAFELALTDQYVDAVSEETAYPETPSISRFSSSKISSFEMGSERRISTEVLKIEKIEEEEQGEEEEAIADEKVATISFQPEIKSEIEEISTTIKISVAEGEAAENKATESKAATEEAPENEIAPDEFTTEKSEKHVTSKTETEITEKSEFQYEIKISVKELPEANIEKSSIEELQPMFEPEVLDSKFTGLATEKEEQEETILKMNVEDIETASLLEIPDETIEVYPSYAVGLAKSSSSLTETAEETLLDLEIEEPCADTVRAEDQIKDIAEDEKAAPHEIKSKTEVSVTEETTSIKLIKELEITIEISHEEEPDSVQETAKTLEIHFEIVKDEEPLLAPDNFKEESSLVDNQVLEKVETKTATVRHALIIEEPFVVLDTDTETLQEDIKEALNKANLLVMDALREANRNVTDTLERTTKEVKSALSLAAKQPVTNANAQVATEDYFLRQPSILESVPRGAESKMVPLTVSITRQLEQNQFTEKQELLETETKEDEKKGTVEEETIKELQAYDEDQTGVLDEDQIRELSENAEWPLERFQSLGEMYWGGIIRDQEHVDIPRAPVLAAKANRSASFVCNDVCGRLSRKQATTKKRDSFEDSNSYSGGESVSDKEMSPKNTEEEIAFIDKKQWQEFAEANKELEQTLSSEAAEEIKEEVESDVVDVEVILQNDIAFPPLSTESFTEVEVSYTTEEEYEATAVQEEVTTSAFKEAISETATILPSVSKEIAPTVGGDIEAEEERIPEPSEEEQSKPESISTELLSSKKSQESRRSRESRRSSKRKESKDVWEPPPIEEIKCRDVCRQSVTSEQMSARKRSKSSSDKETERHGSRRSSRRSSLKYSGVKSTQLDAMETKEGKSKSLQRVQRSSLIKLLESEEARKASRKANNFESKREEIKCYCKECECEICSVEKMKEKVKKLKASKLGKSEDCTCLPDCKCPVCSSSFSDLKKDEEIKQSGDAKEIHDKLPYQVQEEQQKHPPDCECLECLCNSSKIEHWHPEECDCLFCRCCTCSSDPNKRTKNKLPLGECLYEQLCIKEKSSLSNNPLTSIISNVISNSQAPLTDSVDTKLSIVQIPDSSTDTNLMSYSHTHLTESSSKKLSIVQLTYPSLDSEGSKTVTSGVEYISLMNVSSTHPADCDCFDCLCATYSVSTKSSSKNTRKMVDPEISHRHEYLETTSLTSHKEKRANVKNITELEANFEEQKQSIAKLQKAVKQLKCACQTNKVRAAGSSPLELSFVALKKSSFHVTLSGLKLALSNLESKCKQKDQMIATITNELKLRADSKVFDDVLCTLATTNNDQTPADFNRTEICNLLPRPAGDLRYGRSRNQEQEPLECQSCFHQDVSKPLTGIEKSNRKEELPKEVGKVTKMHLPVCLQSDQTSVCKADIASSSQSKEQKQEKRSKAVHGSRCPHKTKSRLIKNVEQLSRPNEKTSSSLKQSKTKEAPTTALVPRCYQCSSRYSRPKHSTLSPEENKDSSLIKTKSSAKPLCSKHVADGLHSTEKGLKKIKQSCKENTLQVDNKQIPLTKSKTPPEEHKRSANKDVQHQQENKIFCPCTKHQQQRPHSAEGRHQANSAKKKHAVCKNECCPKRAETCSSEEPKKLSGKISSCFRQATNFTCILNSSGEHTESFSEKTRRNKKMQRSLGGAPIKSKDGSFQK